jgi:hypothetical protein
MRVSNNDSRLNKKIIRNDASNITEEHELGSVIVMERFIPQNLISDLSRLNTINSTAAPKYVKKANGHPQRAIEFLSNDAGTIRDCSAACKQVFDQIVSFIEQYFDYPFDYNIRERSGQNWRFTNTLFENMHYDLFYEPNQMYIRAFANLSDKPRIWRTSYNLDQLPTAPKGNTVRELLEDATYGNYGSTADGQTNVDEGAEFPFIELLFEPGDVWFAHSQLVSHQIITGDKMVSFSVPVKEEWMKHPEQTMTNLYKRLNK